MSKQFNQYCARVLGFDAPTPQYYDPYNNLNQLVEVVEKLLDSTNRVLYLDQINKIVWLGITTKQAFRDFIESTR